jgi:hypothetical protein
MTMLFDKSATFDSIGNKDLENFSNGFDLLSQKRVVAFENWL